MGGPFVLSRPTGFRRTPMASGGPINSVSDLVWFGRPEAKGIRFRAISGSDDRNLARYINDSLVPNEKTLFLHAPVAVRSRRRWGSCKQAVIFMLPALSIKYL